MSVLNKARDRDANGRLIRAYRHPKFPMSTPGWWTSAHMNCPLRHENRRLCRQVLAGNEPDALAWPLGSRKPHYYYW